MQIDGQPPEVFPVDEDDGGVLNTASNQKHTPGLNRPGPEITHTHTQCGSVSVAVE